MSNPGRYRAGGTSSRRSINARRRAVSLNPPAPPLDDAQMGGNFYRGDMLDLRNCDCMELMRQFPDKHFDLAIVDPFLRNG